MKDKEKSNKGRYLSPSFRKGVVKDKKEEKDEDDGDFKINLINNITYQYQHIILYNSNNYQ